MNTTDKLAALVRFSPDMDGEMEPNDYGTWVRFDDVESLFEDDSERQQAAGAAQPPTIEDINSQSWAGMDGAIAFHLIERHGEDWAHIGRLMQAWLQANNSQQPAPEAAKGVPDGLLLAFSDGPYHVEQRTNAHAEICNSKGRAVAQCSWSVIAKSRAEAICRLLNAALASTPPAPEAQQADQTLRMLANRARAFPHFPMGYHLPELFALLGEEPPQQQAAGAQVEAVAWLVRARNGMVRSCWTTKPDAEQLECAALDGDTVLPLYAAPQPVAGVVPLTDEQKSSLWQEVRFCLFKSERDCYMQGIADTERAHGIVAKEVARPLGAVQAQASQEPKP